MVFISHSSKDKEIADLICTTLEANGIKCWIAPRDIAGGDDWSASITNAISNSKVFIVVYSKNSAESTQVPREIALADSAHSHIIPYKIDDTELSASFKYYLTTNHWVNATASNYNIDGLLAAVQHAMGSDNVTNVNVNNVTININNIEQPTSVVNSPAQKARKAFPIKPVIFGAVGLVTIAAIATLIVILTSDGSNDTASGSTSTSSSTESVSTSSQHEDNSTSENDSSEPEIVAPQNSVAYIPEMIQPYENMGAQILTDDPNESYTVLGESYNTGIILNAYDGSYICLSNTDGYEKLCFTLARIDNTVRGENQFKVYLDGKEQKNINANADFMPQTYEYDISEIKQIKIEMVQNYGVRASYALKDMYFSMNGEQPEITPTENDSPDVANATSDMLPYENCCTEILSDDPNNSYTFLGEQYDSGFLLNAYDSSYIIFDNTEEYEKLSFTLARLDNTERGENELHIYLDGKEQKIIKGNERFMPQRFEYDITGVKQIKIQLAQNYGVRAVYAIQDMYFTKNGKEPEIAEPQTDAPDTAYAPIDKAPYENFCAEILADDPNNAIIIGGNEYHSGIVINAYDASYVIFHNKESYNKLSFSTAKIDGAPDGENTVKVWLDDKQQTNISLNGTPELASYEYDISDISQIVIGIDCNYGSRAEVGLVDISFSKAGE